MCTFSSSENMQKKGLTSMAGGILTEPMITVRMLERRGPRTRDMTSPSKSTEQSISFKVRTRHGVGLLSRPELPLPPPLPK